MKTNKNMCQSCVMPIHHLSDFGTNRDGTINTEYCRHCYLKGVFVDHGISLEEKIERNIDIAHKTGMTKEEATILARETLPTLKRRKAIKPVE